MAALHGMYNGVTLTSDIEDKHYIHEYFMSSGHPSSCLTKIIFRLLFLNFGRNPSVASWLIAFYIASNYTSLAGLTIFHFPSAVFSKMLIRWPRCRRLSQRLNTSVTASVNEPREHLRDERQIFLLFISKIRSSRRYHVTDLQKDGWEKLPQPKTAWHGRNLNMDPKGWEIWSK